MAVLSPGREEGGGLRGHLAPRGPGIRSLPAGTASPKAELTAPPERHPQHADKRVTRLQIPTRPPLRTRTPDGGGVSCCATLSHRPCPLSPRPPAARLGKAAAPGRGRAPGRQRPNARGDDKADADAHRAAPPPPPSAASSCPSRPPQRPPKRNLSLPRLGADEEGPGLRMREGTVHHGATLKAPAGRSELLTRWTQAAFTCP